MSLENENEYRQEKIEKYRTVFNGLFRYIPWLIDKQGTEAAHRYDHGNTNESFPIIVYDPTLLALVKEFNATGVMDRNYRYVLTRNFLHDSVEERKYIASVELKNIEDIFGIISKYVLGGMTKGGLWNEAVMSGVFLDALVRIKELLEVYDKPLA